MPQIHVVSGACCCAGAGCCDGIDLSGDLNITVVESDQCCFASGTTIPLIFTPLLSGGDHRWFGSGLCSGLISASPISFEMYCAQDATSGGPLGMVLNCSGTITTGTFVPNDAGYSCEPPDFVFGMLQAAITTNCCGADDSVAYTLRVTR